MLVIFLYCCLHCFVCFLGWSYVGYVNIILSTKHLVEKAGCLVCTSRPIDFIIAGKVISELSHCKLQFVMKRRWLHLSRVIQVDILTCKYNLLVTDFFTCLSVWGIMEQYHVKMLTLCWQLAEKVVTWYEKASELLDSSLLPSGYIVCIVHLNLWPLTFDLCLRTSFEGCLCAVIERIKVLFALTPMITAYSVNLHAELEAIFC